MPAPFVKDAFLLPLYTFSSLVAILSMEKGFVSLRISLTDGQLDKKKYLTTDVYFTLGVPQMFSMRLKMHYNFIRLTSINIW